LISRFLPQLSKKIKVNAALLPYKTNRFAQWQRGGTVKLLSHYRTILAKRAPFTSDVVAICSQPMFGSHLSFGFSYNFPHRGH
jgi:hypothetical protein